MSKELRYGIPIFVLIIGLRLSKIPTQIATTVILLIGILLLLFGLGFSKIAFGNKKTDDSQFLTWTTLSVLTIPICYTLTLLVITSITDAFNIGITPQNKTFITIFVGVPAVICLIGLYYLTVIGLQNNLETQQLIDAYKSQQEAKPISIPKTKPTAHSTIVPNLPIHNSYVTEAKALIASFQNTDLNPFEFENTFEESISYGLTTESEPNKVTNLKQIKVHDEAEKEHYELKSAIQLIKAAIDKDADSIEIGCFNANLKSYTQTPTTELSPEAQLYVQELNELSKQIAIAFTIINKSHIPTQFAKVYQEIKKGIAQ